MVHMKVLVVDDDPIVLEVTLRILKSLVWDDIIVASSGEELLAQADAFLPELIITDVNMPGISGLCALDKLPDVACIIVSGNPIPKAWQTANAHRIVGTLRKPWRIADMASLIAGIGAAVASTHRQGGSAQLAGTRLVSANKSLKSEQ